MLVGFLGAGLIARAHAAAIGRCDRGFAWGGVYDPDRARAEALAAATGAKVCRSEAELLDACDAVYVCTWTSEHHRLVDEAAARGLAVFCEKPLSTSLQAARAMAASVAAARVVNQVGLVLRRSPAFRVLRQLLRSDRAGRAMSVVFRDDQYIPVRGMYASTWRADVRRAGAGTLLEHSIHDVDLLEWLLGPIVEVSARTRHFHGIDGIEDVAVATLAFAGGAVGSLVSVWHDVDPRPSLRRVEVFCERGWFALEGDWLGPVRWTWAEGDGGVLEGRSLVAAAAALDGDDADPDRHFLCAARTGRPARPDFVTALRAHVVVEAIYRAAASGGAVPVPG